MDKRDDPPAGGEPTDEASRKRYILSKPAYKKVKSNKGDADVDKVSISQP